MAVPAFDFLGLARRIGGKARRLAARGGGLEVVGKNTLGQGTIRMDADLEAVACEAIGRAGIPCTLATEEAGLVEFSLEPKWRFALDPLDGSDNYKRGIRGFCLGLCYAPEGGNAGDVREAYIIELNTGDEFYSRKGRGAWRNGKRVHAAKTKRMIDATVSIDTIADWPWSEPRPFPLSKEGALALWSFRDHRRTGPDLLDMGYTGSGCLDGFVEAVGGLSAIHASGFAFMKETCVVTDGYGKDIRVPLEVEACTSVAAAGTKELHSAIVAALKR